MALRLGMDQVNDFTNQFENVEWVTIALEDRDKTFRSSNAVLCGTSDYFKKALEGEWEESKQRILTLPGCSEETFRLFSYWLTNRRLIYDLSEFDDFQRKLVKLWVFADASLIPKLQNFAMDLFCDDVADVPPEFGAVAEAFEQTPEKSYIRKAIMSSLVHRWKIRTSPTYENYALGEAAINEMGQDIEGFTAAFAKQLEHCQKSKCGHGWTCHPTQHGHGLRNNHQFMVNED